MSIRLAAMSVLLCLSAGAANAQSMSARHDADVGDSDLARPCTSLLSQSDCAIGLPPRPDRLPDREPALHGETSTSHLRGEFGGLNRGDALSRGITGGRIGRGGAEGPLGSHSGM
jgi:hypothetical protein